MLMFACINTKNIFYLFRESLVDVSIRLCTGLFLYKHMHKTSNCLILFLIEVVQFFSIVLYYIVSFHSEYLNSIHGFYVQLGSFPTIWAESFSNYQYWRNVNLKKANLLKFSLSPILLYLDNFNEETWFQNSTVGSCLFSYGVNACNDIYHILQKFNFVKGVG